jgi:hypothetical protein
MRSHAPVVRALLTTTAHAWSIAARVPGTEEDARRPAQRTDDRGRTRLPSGPTVLSFRKADPGSADEAPRKQRADAA